MKQRKPNRHGNIPIPSRYLQINNPLIRFHSKKSWVWDTCTWIPQHSERSKFFGEFNYTPGLNHLKKLVKSYFDPPNVRKWWLLFTIYLDFFFRNQNMEEIEEMISQKESATASTFHLSSLATHWTGASFHPSKPDKDRHAVEKLS